MSSVDRKLVQQKVRQVIYGGDAYDAGEVFAESQYVVAKRMLSDHIRPDGDQEVQNRVNTAIEQITAAIGSGATRTEPGSHRTGTFR